MRGSSFLRNPRSLARRGLHSVCMNRRGYGGQSLKAQKLSMFGFDEDLDAVLAHVAQLQPGRPAAIEGCAAWLGDYKADASYEHAWRRLWIGVANPSSAPDFGPVRVAPGGTCTSPTCYAGR